MILAGFSVATLSPVAIAASACMAGDPVQISPNLVTSVFGKTRMLEHYSEPHVHWGTDFQARDPSSPSKGAPVLATDNGTVVGGGFWGNGYGNRVILKRDDGSLVVYNHLSEVKPEFKAGSGIGFSSDTNGVPVGTKDVSKGTVLGTAGGTGARASGNDYAIHLHLEYITGYGGVKVRETTGSVQAKSRYYQNPEAAFCKVFNRTADAGPAPSAAKNATAIVSSETGKTVKTAPAGQMGGADSASPASSEQAAVAAQAQSTVSDRERYGFPDAPPYPTYGAASESQLVEAESLRRALDTEWEMRLAKMSNRGMWAEIDRLDASLLWMRRLLGNQHQRVEAMYATMLAKQTRQISEPRMKTAVARMERARQAAKVSHAE